MHPPSETATVVDPAVAPETAVAGRGSSSTHEKDAAHDLCKEDAVAAGTTRDESQYLEGKKLFIIFTAFLLSIFLVALDQTIVATALPRIVSDFNALSDVTWVASAYFLTQAGFMLTFGQILTVGNTKWVYIIAIGIFELGSLLCGVAPSMTVLIFGRAVAGVGAAGIFVSVLAIIAQVTRLEDRPVLFGSFGAVFAVSSVVGPLLGGAFTDHVSWRWCFYINLPVGGVAILFILFMLKTRPAIDNGLFTAPGWRKYLQLDWVGTIICLGMVCSLLLPLQWGGNTKEWTDPTVYALFPVFGVLLAIFIAWEWHRGDTAIMPLKLWKRRSQIGCNISSFMLFLGILVATYYLPIFYQATKLHSATKSGIDILPFMLSTVVFAGTSGAVISKTGRYWPWLLVSPLIFAVGGGLLYSLNYETSNAKLIGFQILYGVGIGGAMQNTVIAIQAEYADDEKMVPLATALMNFTQLLGGILGVAIAGTIFSNQIKINLPADLPPDVRMGVIQSVTTIKLLPVELQEIVIRSYIESLRPVFAVAIPAGALASLAALLIKNYDLRKRGGMSMTGGMA